MNLYLVILQRGAQKITQVVRAEHEVHIRRYIHRHLPDLSVIGVLSGIKHDPEIGTVYERINEPEPEDQKGKAFVIVSGHHTLMPKPRGDKS